MMCVCLYVCIINSKFEFNMCLVEIIKHEQLHVIGLHAAAGAQ